MKKIIKENLQKEQEGVKEMKDYIFEISDIIEEIDSRAKILQEISEDEINERIANKLKK